MYSQFIQQKARVALTSQGRSTASSFIARGITRHTAATTSRASTLTAPLRRGITTSQHMAPQHQRWRTTTQTYIRTMSTRTCTVSQTWVNPKHSYFRPPTAVSLQQRGGVSRRFFSQAAAEQQKPVPAPSESMAEQVKAPVKRGFFSRFVRATFKYSLIALALSPILIPFAAFAFGVAAPPDQFLDTVLTDLMFLDKLTPKRGGLIQEYYQFWSLLLMPLILRIQIRRAERRERFHRFMSQFSNSWNEDRRIPAHLSFLYHRSINSLTSYPIILQTSSNSLMLDDALVDLVSQCESHLVNEKGEPVHSTPEIEQKLSDIVTTAGESLSPDDYKLVLLEENLGLSTIRLYLLPYYLESIKSLPPEKKPNYFTADLIQQEIERRYPFKNILAFRDPLDDFPRAFQAQLDYWQHNCPLRENEMLSYDYRTYLDAGFSRPLVTRLLNSVLLNEGSASRSDQENYTEEEELAVFLRDVTIPEEFADKYVYDDTVQGSKEIASALYLIDRVVGQNIIEMIRIHDAQQKEQQLRDSFSSHVDINSILSSLEPSIGSGGSSNGKHTI